MKPINTIDDVIDVLQDIIDESVSTNSPLGYFAALYQKVTKKVKEGIDSNVFEDGERMEKLDVIFAKRYIEAYYDYKNNKAVTKSWLVAFKMASDYWYVVLQHLLVGMNAHINLDLAIAAAEVSKGKNIDDLHSDFNKINEILSDLVDDVEENLSNIWPFLKKILKYTKNVDSFLVDFSMQLARDGAWDFACELFLSTNENYENAIKARDIKVHKKAELITNQGIVVKIIFSILRLLERGTVAKKIIDLTK